MVLPSMTLGRVLCVLHNTRIPSVMRCSALTTPSFNAKRSAVIVRATQEGYATTDSGRNSNITANNASKSGENGAHKGFSYATALRFPESSRATSPGEPSQRFIQQIEAIIERAIFDFRFLALLAIAGSLAGSLLCFLNGCLYIIDSFRVFWMGCIRGVHTGQMVLRLVEAIDVYLAGTVMLIFGMGLYGLFISNVPHNSPPDQDRALQNSSLFGMFTLKMESWRWWNAISGFRLKNAWKGKIVAISLTLSIIVVAKQSKEMKSIPMRHHDIEVSQLEWIHRRDHGGCLSVH